MESRKFKLLFPNAIMLHFKEKDGQIYYLYNDTLEDIRSSSNLWGNIICPTILGLNSKETEIWKNEDPLYKIKTLYKIEEKHGLEPDSLSEKEFEKLFPNFSIPHFITKPSKRVYYYGNEEYLSLYSYIFWRAKRKVDSLNMDEQGMSMWRQDKSNFLRNWRNYYESNPSSPSFQEKTKSWIKRLVRWAFKRYSEEEQREIIRTLTDIFERAKKENKLEIFTKLIVLPLTIIIFVFAFVISLFKE